MVIEGEARRRVCASPPPSRRTSTDSGRSATPSHVQVCVHEGTRWEGFYSSPQDARTAIVTTTFTTTSVAATTPIITTATLYRTPSHSCPNLTVKPSLSLARWRSSGGRSAASTRCSSRSPRPASSFAWAANLYPQGEDRRDYGGLYPSGREPRRSSAPSCDLLSAPDPEVALALVMSRRDSRKMQDLLVLEPQARGAALLKVPGAHSSSSSSSSPVPRTSPTLSPLAASAPSPSQATRCPHEAASANVMVRSRDVSGSAGSHVKVQPISSLCAGEAHAHPGSATHPTGGQHTHATVHSPQGPMAAVRHTHRDHFPSDDEAAEDSVTLVEETVQPSSSRPEGCGGREVAHTSPNTTTETVPRRNLVYRDDNIAYVVEGLYLGNITAAYSQPLLCRLDVQCVVDLSGTRPTQVPADKKSICPCTCPLTTPHHRSRLCIDIPDSEEVDIRQFSSEVTRFIHAAHLKGKNVLVHSYKGQSRAPALVILYLITIVRMSFAQALSLVQTSYPCVALNPAFRMTLQEVDRRLSPPPSPSPGPDTTTTTTTTNTTATTTSTTTTTHPKIKTAWT